MSMYVGFFCIYISLFWMTSGATAPHGLSNAPPSILLAYDVLQPQCVSILFGMSFSTYRCALGN